MHRYYRIMALVIAAWCSSPAAGRSCPPAALAAPKSSVLYLYYPAVTDNAFPNWQSLTFNTSPLPAFNLNDLDGSIGTEADLRTRVQQMAETALCEFDVAVRSVTALAPMGSRWQVIGLGSDLSNPDPNQQGMAVAEHEDIGDAGAQDYARVWLRDVANWDFVNPNADSASQLRIRILSPSETLTLAWHYQGNMNPWVAADVVLMGGPVQFRGVDVYEHLLVFHDPKPWANGPAGIVPGGASFHVGASFHESDPIVVHEATLIGSVELDLHPRMVDFAGHTGFRPAGPGRVPGFELAFGNPGDGTLLLRDLDVRFSPRMIDIETMMQGFEPAAWTVGQRLSTRASRAVATESCPATSCAGGCSGWAGTR